MNAIRRWLRRILFAEERIEIDGEEYVRRWPVSEKEPRPSGGWRRIKKGGKLNRGK